MWEYPDIESFLMARDTGEGMPINPERSFDLFNMGGISDDGTYVIDPDYFEIMGLTDPSQLIRFHR